jgi:hypothetical protein
MLFGSRMAEALRAPTQIYQATTAHPALVLRLFGLKPPMNLQHFFIYALISSPIHTDLLPTTPQATL